MNEPVMIGEFNRAIERLSKEVVDGNVTSKETLVEAKKTNGRVYALELGHAVLTVKLDSACTDLGRRVDGVEESAASTAADVERHAANLKSQIENAVSKLHQQALDNPPLTRRDLWLVTGVVSGTATATVGIVVALVKWLPALLAAGRVAP